jgi:branched-chain amino acid transport system permease protein
MLSEVASIVSSGIIAGAGYALVATGFNVVERTTRIFNFGHGDLLTVGPIVALVLLVRTGVPTWAALVVGVLGTFVVALFVERLAIRPYINRQDSYLWLISTLGASAVLEAGFGQPFQSQSVVFSPGLSQRPMTWLLPFSVSPQQGLLILVSAVICLALMIFYKKTTIGLMLVAVGEDPDGAGAIGISAGRMSQVAMLFAAMTAAAAGLILAPLSLVSPQFGFSFTFIGFVAASIGGLGSIKGGYVGGFIIGILVQAVTVVTAAGWSDTAVFAALLAVYLIRPAGLFGRASARSVLDLMRYVTYDKTRKLRDHALLLPNSPAAWIEGC